MNNIADLIENYILRQLAAQTNGHVELRRTDIAEEISCAPSQITYVLSTRFTPARGFVVESRRGLGGFIRIAQVPMPMEKLMFEKMLKDLEEDPPYETVESMLEFLLKRKFVTKREAAMMLQLISLAYENFEPEERLKTLKTIFLTIARLSES